MQGDRAALADPAYPSGTHFSGSTVSQFWYRFSEPRRISGYLASITCHLPA